MRFRAALILLGICGLSSACFGGLSEASPTDNAIAFWRVSTAAPSSTPTWIQRQLSDTFVKAAALFDDDPATGALARVSAFATTNGLANTGVALMSEQDARDARAKVVADSVAKRKEKFEAYKAAYEASRKDAKQSKDAQNPPGSPTSPGASAPTSDPLQSPAPIAPMTAPASPTSGDKAGEKAPVELPPFPLLELPPRAPKSMALEIVLRGEQRSAAEIMRLATGVPVDPAGETVTIGPVAAHKLSVNGWVRPLLWGELGGRLIVATDERAMKYATSDATGEGDVLREDWSGQRAAVSGARKSAKPVGAIIINYNAIRKELGDEWEVSFASRLLNSIKMPNLRSIMLHAGVQEASADNSNVPVLLLDATWSAKSDAPGQCLREELTLDKVPTKRSPAFIPGAELQVSIRPTYRAVADWVFKAYLSDIASNEEVAGKVYQSWKYWLGDHRAVLNKVTENLGSWCVLALSRLSDANSPPVVHFRSTMRSGMGSESAIEGLELLCKPVDIAVSKVPEHPDVWSVPVKSAFVQGSIGWANARSFGMPVIVGNIAMGDFDLVASVRDDVEHADGVQPVSTRPAPKPAPGGSTGASPGTPPASKPPSK